MSLSIELLKKVSLINVKDALIKEKVWAIAHGNGIVHFVECDSGGQITTGQDNLEFFSTEEQALIRCGELAKNLTPEQLIKNNLIINEKILDKPLS